MKKILLAVAVVAMTCLAANAQVDKNAIGLRLGGGSFSGGEISYQLGLGQANRLELDLGFGGNKNYSSLGLSGIYQWVWPIGGQGFNWYVGPGAGLSINTGKGGYENFFGLAIGGQIGVGYNFNIPLGLTLDTRPMWDFLADADGFGWGLALGVRYRF